MTLCIFLVHFIFEEINLIPLLFFSRQGISIEYQLNFWIFLCAFHCCHVDLKFKKKKTLILWENSYFRYLENSFMIIELTRLKNYTN